MTVIEYKDQRRKEIYDAQYQRLKLVMTPEAAKAFQKARCADCGKQLQSDDRSQETAEGALCEECLEGRGGGVTCEGGDVYDFKIEQKPFCACCSAFEYGVTDWRETEGKEPIRHEDPCQFSHAERWMLPLAKKMFRERQETLRQERHARVLHKENLAALTAHELKYGANSARNYPDVYNRLTTGRCGV